MCERGRVTPEMLSAAAGREVEVWTAREVGADPDRAGSSVDVLSYREDTPARAPVLLRDRGPAELVSAPPDLPGGGGSRPGPAPEPPEPAGEVAGSPMGSLVLVTEANGALAEEALPLPPDLNRVRRA